MARNDNNSSRSSNNNLNSESKEGSDSIDRIHGKTDEHIEEREPILLAELAGRIFALNVLFRRKRMRLTRFAFASWRTATRSIQNSSRLSSLQRWKPQLGDIDALLVG